MERQMAHADTLRILADLGPEKTADLVERLAGVVMRVSDGLEDDRVYLGTTNQMTELRDATQAWFELRYLDAEVN
jgi:hypothetical protein